MFRRFLAWIDSFADRFNPITVRDARRSKTRYMLEGSTLVVLTILTVGFTAVLLTLDGYEEYQVAIFGTAEMSRDEIAWFLAVLPLWVAVYGLLFFMIIALSGLTKDELEDELLRLVPLSPKEYADGYMTSAFVFSVYCVSLIAPFMTVAGLIGRAPLWPLAALAGMFLGSLMFSSMMIAFSARMKRRWEGVLMGVSGYLIIYAVAAPWLGCIFLLDEVFHKPEPSPLGGFGLFSLAVVLPAALLAFTYLGYRLSIYHFAHRKAPYWRSVLMNAGVYFTASVALAAVYLLLGVVFL